MEGQFQETQQMRNKFNISPNANNMVELLDNIEDLHDEIGKWAERFQSFNENVSRWREKNSSFENSMGDLGANLSLRNKRALDIEEHIDFLKLMLGFEDKMNDYKVKVATWRLKSNVQTQLQEELSNSFQGHKNKMDGHHANFLSSLKHTKEELKKVEGRKRSNTDNQNIERFLKHIEHKLEESGNRIEVDRAEISQLESDLEALKSKINVKCKEEINYPPNKMLKIEHNSKVKELCTKLDRWNEEYESFQIEHDQWIKMKNQLEHRMKSTEQNIDAEKNQFFNLHEGYYLSE